MVLGPRCVQPVAVSMSRDKATAPSGFRGKRERFIPASFARNGPCLVRVVFLYRRGDVARLWAQVLLIDPALLVDDEGHDAGFTILGRPRDQGEPTDHVSVDEII